jgi:hypothetical protein
MNDKPAAKDFLLLALTGHNRVIILCGAAVGLLTGLAAWQGVLTQNAAIPTFGWILFGLLLCELGYGALKNAPPASLVTMAGRFLALAAGVVADMLTRKALGVGW